MAASISDWAAREALTNALKQVKNFKPTVLTPDQQRSIQLIIMGDHLTFRYIMITALLAKVVNRSIHMRSLQEGAALTGAYDARSLCHDVWVPFEHEHLDNRLGGSNEPYLNKPARYKAVDKTNACRAGSDRILLNTLYDVLEQLNSASPAHHEQAFLFAMALIMARTGQTAGDIKLTPMLFSAPTVQRFLDVYLRESFGGEVPVSVVSALLSVRLDETNDVKVHPANQAGSSSNEVGDIDVYEGKKVSLPIEVKDKAFTKTDVDHACGKAKAAGCPRLMFVKGRNGSLSGTTEDAIATAQAANGFDLSFISIDDLVSTEVRVFSATQRQQLIQTINRCLSSMRRKDETARHFDQCLKASRFVA